MKWMMVFIYVLCLLSLALPRKPVVTELTSSDKYIRDRVVMLNGNGGQCTGIQIKAPSGKVYTLTAGHCIGLLSESNTVKVTHEDGRKDKVKLLKLRTDIDLMLLTSNDTRSIDVADNLFKYEHVRTLTHGDGRPTYRTDGELLNEQKYMVGVPEESGRAFELCVASKKHTEELTLFGIVCLMPMTSQISTVSVIPGSSGGPALDGNGKLIGIVSNGEGFFSGLVPLHDIQKFIKNK